MHASQTRKHQSPPQSSTLFLQKKETTLASGVNRHWNRHASRSTRKRNLRSKIWWFTYSAIRITYRISLRSSSLREPRHPLLKVVRMFLVKSITHFLSRNTMTRLRARYTSRPIQTSCTWGDLLSVYDKKQSNHHHHHSQIQQRRHKDYTRSISSSIHDSSLICTCSQYSGCCKVVGLVWIIHFNDPSAGSPTETLLRLHLPLNGKV